MSEKEESAALLQTELDEDTIKRYATIGVLLMCDSPLPSEEDYSSLLVRNITRGAANVQKQDIIKYKEEGLLTYEGELTEKSYELTKNLRKVWAELPQRVRELYVSKYNPSATVSNINARRVRNDKSNFIANLLLQKGDHDYNFHSKNQLKQLESLFELNELAKKSYIKFEKTDTVYLKNKGKLPHPIPCEICSEFLDKKETLNNRIKTMEGYGRWDDNNYEFRDVESFAKEPNTELPIPTKKLLHDFEWFKKHNIEVLQEYEIKRGENFWKGAAEYLMKKEIKELPLKEDELEELRKHYPDFNRESNEMCPANLPKEKCEREWKRTDSLVFFAHSDIGNARFLLHAYNPGVYVKAKDNERKVSISIDDFKEIFETASEMNYTKPKKHRVRKPRIPDSVRKNKNFIKFQEEQKKTLLTDKIQKQDNTVIIDLSENSDEDFQRGRYISLDVLKKAYEELAK